MATRHSLAMAGVLTAVLVAPARADDKLVYIIPNLFGPRGLVVDSQARLPSGETHSAHFNSAFQAQFTQFNVALASQLSSIPLPSPASGLTFEFDPTLGTFTRSTQSLGPILADRAETIGHRRLSVGFTYQRFTFDTIEGLDLGGVPAIFTHDEPSPGGRADVVQTRNSISANVDQIALLLSYGLLDRLDLSIAVPLNRIELSVASEATVQRIGTASSPATHFFDGGAEPFGTTRRFEGSGTASGIGDVILRAKGTVLKSKRAGVALGADVRIPTGDEEDLLGAGTLGVKPFVAFSMTVGPVAPHLDVAYQWNGRSVLAGDVVAGVERDMPDVWLYAAGLDVALGKRLTMAVDLLGRRIVDSPRLVPTSFSALDGSSRFDDVRFETDSFGTHDASVGIKINVTGNLLLDLNAVVSLDENGLRDDVTPLVGLEFTF